MTERKIIMLKLQQWHRRYFVLYAPPSSSSFSSVTTQCIAEFDYYNDAQKTRKKGSIDLFSCEELLQKMDSPLYQHVFSLRTKHHGRERTYYLAADTEADMNKWVAALCHVLHLDIKSKVICTKSRTSSDGGTASVAPTSASRQSSSYRGSDSSSVAGSTHLSGSPVASLSLSTSEEHQPSVDETYILLDECYSGSSNLSSTPSLATSADYRSAPTVSYHNLDSSWESRATDTLDSESLRSPDSSLSTRRAQKSEDVFYNLPEGDVDADEGIWDCQSSVGTASLESTGRSKPDSDSGVPMLPAKTSTVSDEYDVPPAMPVHRAAVPNPQHALVPPPAPHPHMAIPGRVHRYVNTAPAILRTQSPISAASKNSAEMAGCLRTTSVPPPRPSPQLPPKAHNFARSSPVPERTYASSAAAVPSYSPPAPPVCTERTVSFKRAPARNGSSVVLPIAKMTTSDSSSLDSEDGELDSGSVKPSALRAKEIQYVSLDLDKSSDSAPAMVFEKSPRTSANVTVYDEVDLVKTQALASMKKELETKRKSSDRSLDA